ncbi:hypothetical protein [Mammaliicoccus vitulinus]|uniref:hypothetical protein n=1 Tax=Mammaliicoccus vitulinus TaxID=71237 RepID=UPI00248AD88A|nr:hypothetical protein [Mammaliicoccus vitulinus]
MKVVSITKEMIFEGFKEEGFIKDDLHHQLINEGKVILVDPKNCILIKLGNKKYWITTEPKIKLGNKNCDYDITIEYQIHAESKYSEALYTFER